MPEKRPRKVQLRTVFILHFQGSTALCRRPDKGLLAGLWEFPNVEGRLDENAALAQADAWGCGPVKAALCGESVHIFTHLEWHMVGWRIECTAASERFTWAGPGEWERYPVPTAFRVYKAQATSIPPDLSK